ncbi:hypothetical protein BHM03_00043592, partial [Ensete ventricosum]
LGCGRGQMPRCERIPPRFCSVRPPISVPIGKCQYGRPPRGRTSRARCRWIFTSEARRLELRGLIMMACELRLGKKDAFDAPSPGRAHQDGLHPRAVEAGTSSLSVQYDS